MKKILFVANLDRFMIAFHQDLIKKLSSEGWIVDVASYGDREIKYVNKKYSIPITRSPLKLSNFKAIRQLRRIINENNYDIVHSQTPMGGIVARIANNSVRTKNVYSAHGFHFHKGGPIINWIFYPIERYLSKKTDLLITTNNEDFERAKRKFRNTLVKKVDGVGINFDRFDIISTAKHLKKELNLNDHDFIISSIGDLKDTKNQFFAMRVIKNIVKKNSNVKYLIIGEGPNRTKYEKYISKYNLEKNMILTGYRSDVPEILNLTKLLLSTSKREGQGLNVVEAMRMKCVVLVSNIRGHEDLIEDGINGFTYKLGDKKEFITKISSVLDDYNNMQELTEKAFHDSDNYDNRVINKQLLSYYLNILKR